MVITQVAKGPFKNHTPKEAEVVQDSLKDLLKPGEVEEKARELILQVFGRWMHDCVPTIDDPSSLGIEATEFSCFFMDPTYL